MMRKLTVPAVLALISAFVIGCGVMKGAMFQNAERAFERGDYEEAKRLYLQIIEKYPRTEFATKAKFRLGQIYEREFEWDKAIKYFDEVTKEVKGGYLDMMARSEKARIQRERQVISRAQYVYDNNPGTEKGNEAAAQALHDMAQAYERLGQYEKAIETYRKLIKEFPQYANVPQILYQIGSIYFYKLYDYDKGWQAYLEVIKKHPDSEFARYAERTLKDTDMTLKEIAAQIETIKKFRKEVAVKFEKANRHVTQADKYGIYTDQIAQSYIAIAEGWRKLRNYPNAIKAYKELADELPFEQAAQIGLFRAAELYQEMGNYEMAIKTYNELLKRYPHTFRRADATYNKAICYETMREFEKAYELYKAYLSLPGEEQDDTKVRRAEEKVRQWSVDGDGDGYPFYIEAQYGTSDSDPTSYPER